MPEILGYYQKTFVIYFYDYMIFSLSINNVMNEKILIFKPFLHLWDKLYCSWCIIILVYTKVICYFI